MPALGSWSIDRGPCPVWWHGVRKKRCIPLEGNSGKMAVFEIFDRRRKAKRRKQITQPVLAINRARRTAIKSPRLSFFKSSDKIEKLRKISIGKMMKPVRSLLLLLPFLLAIRARYAGRLGKIKKKSFAFFFFIFNVYRCAIINMNLLFSLFGNQFHSFHHLFPSWDLSLSVVAFGDLNNI